MSSKTSRFRIFGKSIGAAKEVLTPRQEAERFIEKERFQEAVKQAKLAYKAEAAPEHHRLLERAYFLRARQLARQGMRASAVEVAGHLLDFGPTASDDPAELARFLIGLGHQARARAVYERLAGPEGLERFRAWADDDLVAHPEHASGADPKTASDAALVRAALERIQAGDDAGAAELLRGLARSSPLSEWKFFARGLSAFYQGDEAEARANWNRLGPDRSATRIAERLRARRVSSAAGTGGGDGAGAKADAPTPELEALERQAFGEPVLGRLRQLREHVAAHEWKDVFRLLGPLRHGLGQVDPKLAERLTASLIGPLIKSAQEMRLTEAERLLKQFSRTAQPLAIDPRWNRLHAIAWDGPQAGVLGAVNYWEAYAKDLDSVSVLGPAERTLARALVWKHVAELWNERVTELDEEEEGPAALLAGAGLPFRPRPAATGTNRELLFSRKQAVASLEKGLVLVPKHLPSLQLLVQLHEDWDDEEGMASAARRLLTVFPENFEALERLVQYHTGRNELDAALPLVEKARRLKPLDEAPRKSEWYVRVSLARQRALEGRFDEGRALFAEVKRLSPEDAHGHILLAREAMLEHKAGETRRGDALVQEAQAGLLEPTALWLVLAIEAARFQMPPAVVAEHQKKWDAARKKTCRSETAGEISSIMAGFLKAEVEYPDRKRHIEEVVAYLRRTTRTRFRRSDIEDVADFLALLPDEHKLRGQILARGLKQHPDSARLHVHAGQAAMIEVDSPKDIHKVQDHFETALRLAQKSSGPEIQGLVPHIQRSLSLIAEVRKRFLAFPFGDIGLLPPFFMDDDDSDEFDDDDFDDGDFDGDGPFFASPGPKRSSAPKSKPKAKSGGKKGKPKPKRGKK